MDWESFISILQATSISYIGVIAVTRVNGLRTFSKMSSFDFAATVAVGSLMATTITSDKVGPWEGVFSVATLVAVQRLVAALRRRSSFVDRSVNNQPLLLMWEGAIHEEGMRRGRVTRDDLYAKLREANCFRPEQVRAVVLETTGDISVLHGREKPSAEFLCGVWGLPEEFRD